MLGDDWIISGSGCVSENELSGVLGLYPLTGRLLASRGYDTVEKAKAFIKKDSLKLYDPFLMKDMDKAVARIKTAITEKQRVCIYGDYDVDGVTSTAILYKYLTSMGVPCECFIPERLSEGYGLNMQAVMSISERTDLIITVDTGVTAFEEVEYANSAGVDIVITDHHSCKEKLPAACAVVNPHREDCRYPFKELAGVGVVFKLLCALEGDTEKILNEFADIVAIGTVADVMPVTDENRLIIHKGLQMLQNTKSPGLFALLKQSGFVKDGKIKPVHTAAISFSIAPKLNAAGRISSAGKALDLFLAEDMESAEIIADELCEINKKRQVTEQIIYEEALTQITKVGSACSYVLGSEKWHQGVIGVIASKISEKYSLPAILFSFDGDIGKGSGRSITGFNLIDALEYCKDLLIEYGGHQLAAGLSIKKENFIKFVERFEQYAEKSLEGKTVVSPVEIDCPIYGDEITVQHADQLSLLEPYGLTNRAPLFILENAQIKDVTPISEDKHLRLTVRSFNGKRDINCIYFGISHSEFPFFIGDSCEIACCLTINEYNNIRSPQLMIRAVRPCEQERTAIKTSRRVYDVVYTYGSSGLPESVIPSLEQFREVFRVLKREVGNTNHRISIRYIKRKVEQTEGDMINLCTLKVILDVLDEFNLVNMVRIRDFDLVDLSLMPYKDKIDIEQSKILKDIRKKMI